MRILTGFAAAVALIAFVLLLFVILLDFAGGCGEVFIYADGSEHPGECIGRDILFSYLGG